ncbi:MAG: AAA domain-containing protein [Firmicutes bacterium]|nr:AAA domain-containing protein [Bacillota bacterium]
MKNIYSLYRNRLVEISGRSRSLYAKGVTKRQAYNLGKLLENTDEAKRLVDFLWDGNQRKFKLFNGNQTVDLLKNIPNELHKKTVDKEHNELRALQREMDSMERETGRYELFVGYPYVVGHLGSSVVKAPLVLFPARICDEKGIELEILREEPVVLNKVFLLAFAKEYKLDIEELATEFSGNLSVDFADLKTLLDYLKHKGINLKPCKNKGILDIEKAKETYPKLEVEIRNFCVLGRFPLANAIYHDYRLMEKNKLSSPAIDVLLKTKEVKVKNKNQGGIFNVKPLDFAQEEAIDNINKYNNVVIYGPPGTGKSQVVTNIISDALAKGKKVLMVSQKRTALDVVYNRLGHLSTKVMMIPDPEKSKNEVYEKIRHRYNQVLKHKNTFDNNALENINKNIDTELGQLQTISDTLFTPTEFGAYLQKMYLKSARLGKNPLDYHVHEKMKGTSLMSLDYRQLEDASKSLKQKNTADLFYNHYLLAKENPIIEFIKTGLNIDQINRVKTYVQNLLSGNILPFNLSKYQYSRYMMVYSLEDHFADLKPLANMIVRLESPKLAKRAKFCGMVPLLWPVFPFVKHSLNKKRNKIINKLDIARQAVRHYVTEFDLLKTVLEPDGFAMVLDNITYGNNKFLKKLSSALDDYMTLKDVVFTLKSLNEIEKVILDFAFEITNNKKDFVEVTDSVLPVRIYHEIVKEEKLKETQLAKTIVYDDLKNRIIALKEEKMAHNIDCVYDKFNDEFKNYWTNNQEAAKNFLHQINKQQKTWPIRKLFSHFEQHLLNLFPCWMLSPEAVSQVLPLKPDLFDLVLFDEASQIFIESTIPAIYRSKCVVVSGDNKQLKPTNVFIKRYSGNDNAIDEMALSDQAAVEVESLLDLATSRLRQTHLTYHYRSRYEELISFSNYAFYEGRLQIAPNNTKSKNYRPIERIKVSGKWDKRRNLVEAEKVVDIVADIFKNRKNKETIGIVSFNLEQQECIEEAFDKKCAKDAAFKLSYNAELNRKEDGEYAGLFIKNLENVQGDERDIIIFSVGYAKSDGDKLTANFGSLSMAGGENRLNVAITRAKQKIFVVTSVEPEDFSTIDNTKNLGPKLFKKYLQYARAVSNKETAEAKIILNSLLTVKREEDDAHLLKMESEIKLELEKHGYTVEQNLGDAEYKLSLAIYDKGLDKYVLGLECDYAAFNSSESVLERDVYRNAFLESRNWKIMRIWSRDYWTNKPALISAIVKEIEKQKLMIVQSRGGKKAAIAPMPKKGI